MSNEVLLKNITKEMSKPSTILKEKVLESAT